MFWMVSEVDLEYVMLVEWRSRDSWRKKILYMKYKNMKEISHGLQKIQNSGKIGLCYDHGKYFK